MPQHTDLTTDDVKQLLALNIPPDCPQIISFWNQLKSNWSELRPQLLAGAEEAFSELSNYLPDLLKQYVQFEVTYNEINRQNLDAYNGYIELYISPKVKKDNVPVMKAIYAKRVQLPGLVVSCYKAYNPADLIIQNIDYDDYKVSYDDFGYQGYVGYEKHNGISKPVFNMVILVKKSIAGKLLKQKTVNFVSEDGKQSSRDVWLPNDTNAIDLILLNIVGEYNLVNHTGYIEFVPEDDPLIAPGSTFIELADIKKDLELLYKQFNYAKCNYCNHNELQTKIVSCGRCRQIKYCNKQCQRADWVQHKQICNLIE